MSAEHPHPRQPASTPDAPSPPTPNAAAASTESAGSASTHPGPPRTFRGYLRAVGPGLVIALAWLGTGDLIDSSVAGANYGYEVCATLPLTSST